MGLFFFFLKMRFYTCQSENILECSFPSNFSVLVFPFPVFYKFWPSEGVHIYRRTCLKRPLYWPQKCGLSKQVVSGDRFSYIEMQVLTKMHVKSVKTGGPSRQSLKTGFTVYVENLNRIFCSIYSHRSIILPVCIISTSDTILSMCFLAATRPWSINIL